MNGGAQQGVLTSGTIGNTRTHLYTKAQKRRGWGGWDTFSFTTSNQEKGGGPKNDSCSTNTERCVIKRDEGKYAATESRGQNDAHT